MESIYAALLLHKAGGKINETNVEKVLTAAGAKVDKDQIVKLIAGLKSTKIEDIIKSASSVPIAAAPTEADIAECSDSTLIISLSTIPSATNFANVIAISV